MAQSQLTATSASQVQTILLSQALKYLGLVVCHHAHLIFVFWVETEFHHVSQVGLKLPTSHDPTTQSAEITGVSHHTQLVF